MTAASKEALEAALAAAEAVLADADAAREDLDQAMEGLVKAIGGLEYGVQKLHLETAIEAAEAILADGKNYENAEALAEAAASADVNGDGKADTSDAVLILQYAAEKIAAF